MYDFIYIDDAAEMFYLLGDNGKSGENYYIGTHWYCIIVLSLFAKNPWANPFGIYTPLWSVEWIRGITNGEF